MKKLFTLLAASLSFGLASAQTDLSLAVTSIKLSNGMYVSLTDNKDDAGSVIGHTATIPYCNGVKPTIADVNLDSRYTGATVELGDEVLTVTNGDETLDYTVSYKEIETASLSDGEEVVFDGTEAYVWAPAKFNSSKNGYVFQKSVQADDNKRISQDKVHVYFVLPKAESAVFSHNGSVSDRAIKVYVNGVEASGATSIGKSTSFTVELSKEDVNVVVVESNQTKGDGSVSAVKVSGVQMATAIKNINSNVEPTKGSLVIKNNALVIVRGGKTYNLLGQEL